MSQLVNQLESGNNFLAAFSAQKQALRPAIVVDKNLILKRGIWVYFILLIFEGALRKWVFPGLATPLLIVRDPIAIGVLFLAWKRDIWPRSYTLITIMLIGIISIFTGFYFGHGNALVALFGARVFLLHFPLMYVIGKVFTKVDVIKMGKVTLWLSIPMVLLIALQFFSPQSAWVNRGVGGDLKGGGFIGAMGFFRPPGTFSFTTGVSQFFAFVGAFVCYFWYDGKQINRALLVTATVCLLVSIPLSISRGLFFSVGVSFFFGLVLAIRKPKLLGRALFAGIAIVLLFMALGKSGMFQSATNVFNSRFESANKSEGGLQSVFLDRYFGGMIGALQNSADQPFFGYGSGMGTNAGAMLLTGKQTFLISEGEWGRLIGELGPLLGIIVILLRLNFSWQLSLAAYRRLKSGNILPWMLLSYALINIPQGQWAQPTSLGFGVIIGGLLLASLNEMEATQTK